MATVNCGGSPGSENAIPSAVIEHPDTSNNERGTIISLGEEATGITWDQVRDDVFHPNSNAWLKPVV